jgi:glycosyltransferase involved in cell wall biosynthesis
MHPSVSVVINTLNRGPELQKALHSLQWLKYPGDFEVIVVNGPSDDDSDSVIATWLPKIRAAKCKVPNLSVSRNIGICMAQGDIVAFIDDDAIPEPEWLTQLAGPYIDPMVGAAGGFVFDHTGYNFQYRFCTVDRFGNPDLSPHVATPYLAFPKSYRFPHLLGCNSSFRRTALLEVRGFDEEFEYFLDETDLCVRIIDAGYIIAQLPGAYVHHKYAPSTIRGTNRVVRNWYPILKNKLYFMMRHAREFHSLQETLDHFHNFTQQRRDEVTRAATEKLISEVDRENFNSDVERAMEVGLRRGFEGVAAGATINREKQELYAGQFKSFHPLDTKAYKVIVIVSRHFPTDPGGGIAALYKTLAESLAELGNIVHVITQSDDVNRVDFECGVWVHRMTVASHEPSTEAANRLIPAPVWNWSVTALREAKRIATHHPIDVVEAPVLDCEGAAFLLDAEWPLVAGLHSTLNAYLDSHRAKRDDHDWMKSFGRPMLALEQELMTRAAGIRAINHATIEESESLYELAKTRHQHKHDEDFVR